MDELIIRGIFYNNHQMYNYSRAIYDELYSRTKLDDFLFNKANASLLSGNDIDTSILELENHKSKSQQKDIISKRLLISLYLFKGDMKQAKKILENLLDISKTSRDYELASTVFLYEGNYKKALNLLNKSYTLKHQEETLLQIANIMLNYTYEYKKAIQLLEMHRRMNIISSKEVFKMLVELYVKTNDINGVLQTYKALYIIEPKEMYLAKIVDAYVYMADFKGAIGFFEDNKPKDKILFDLYQHEKMYQKAIKFATEAYRRTHDPSWLAKKAIITYESAKDKKDLKMIKKLISYFDRAIKEGADDSSYFNYYGYTLIDSDIDIQKGIDYIKKALAQQPNNAYYIDSLAWGYYKINQCKKAYKLMKEISSKEIEETIELKEHFEAIKKCK
jgi:tetratricopeptide (TPR) repeat protein